jgi:hypothetical protein
MKPAADIRRAQRRAHPGWATTAQIVAAALLLTFGAFAAFVALFTWQNGVFDLDIDRTEPLSPAPYVAFYGMIAAACFVLTAILAMRVRRALTAIQDSEKPNHGRLHADLGACLPSQKLVDLARRDDGHVEPSRPHYGSDATRGESAESERVDDSGHAQPRRG